ncbi:reverse transcriptase domain-containing protein [Tanacetum coccineum]
MAETMEQYTSKTRADYGSGITRPKIDDKDSFELKGQFLKELRDSTFSRSDHEDANEHIEKVLEIFDLFHIPNITQDQVMLRAFPMSLTRAASHWLRNKPSGSITTWEDLKIKFLSKYCPPAHTAKKIEEINNFQQEPDKTLYQVWKRFKELLMKCPQHYLTEMQEVILFYNGLDVQTRQILNSKGAIPSKTAADAKLNNLGREIKKVNEKVYAAQVGCEQCKGPQYTKDCPLKEERASVSVMPLSTYLNLGLGELAHTKLTVELADRTVEYTKGIAKNVLVGIGKFVFPIDFIILDMLEDIKVPLIPERPFLSTAHAKIDVFKRKITLRVRDEKVMFKSVKPAIYIIWYQEPKFLIKMPPRKNRTLNEITLKRFGRRVMRARCDEQFDQFVDQLSDRMDQMMNRHSNHNVQGTDDEQLENPFGEDDNSFSDEQSGRRPRQNQREDNRRWESGMRVNILDFARDPLSPERFIDWLVAVEEVFEFKEIPENKRVSLIATKLHVNLVTDSQNVRKLFEDELEMGDDVFVLKRKEVAEDCEIPEAMIPLLEEFLDVFPDERSIPNFSSIMAPLTDCMKGKSFVWTEEAELAFQVIKEKLTTSPILLLPDFSKVFELYTDASKVAIGGVLSHGRRHVAYFSEKLTEPKSRYTTYDLKFYVVVQAVKHWRHHLFHKEFVLFTNHDSLRHIRTQDKEE